MTDTFEYFWVEVEVERAADGSVEWFQTYDFDEEDGERSPYSARIIATMSTPAIRHTARPGAIA